MHRVTPIQVFQLQGRTVSKRAFPCQLDLGSSRRAQVLHWKKVSVLVGLGMGCNFCRLPYQRKGLA